MYGTSNEAGMAAICERVDPPLLRRQTQRPDSCRSLVAGCPQHGAGMAYPSQPSTSQRQCTSDSQADMEGVRSLGDGDRRHKSESCTQEQLASLGHSARDRRESLHSQGKEDVVIADRPTGPVSTDNVLQLLEHQHYRCALTGRVLAPQTASIDHIVPIRLGGEHTIENTQILHKDVNRAKGSMTSEEFVGMCREVARWSESVSNPKEN